MTDAPFNIDEWISGAKLPEKVATVYGRADLVAEYVELDQQLTEAQKETVVADERLTGSGRASLARRMTEVRDAMQASALTFRFRALLKEESKAIRAAAPKGPDGEADADYIAVHWIAAASVHPRITPEQAAVIRSKIGEGQFASLWEAAWDVANDRKVSVPFSLAHSAAVSTPDS